MKIRAFALALLIGAGAAQPGSAAPGANAGGPIEPADIMKLKDVRDAAIAPDGKTILFTVQQRMATFSPEHSTIWRVPSDGSMPARPFIVSAGADDTPRWSPDGKWVAFLSNRKSPLTNGADLGFGFKSGTATTPTQGRPVDAVPSSPSVADEAGEPSRQVWLIPLAGGEAVPLTALPGDVSDIEWSPDGKRIAFISVDPETPTEKADKAAKRDAIDVDHSTHVVRLWILDVAAHTAQCISPPELNVSGVAWSPDGHQLALRVADTPAINNLFYHSRIVLFDPATREVGATLIEHAASEPRWSRDGGAILADVVLEPGFIGAAVRVYDLAAHRIVKLGDDWPGLLTHPQWAPDSRSIVALSFEQTRSRLVRVALNGSITPLAAFDGEAEMFSLSHDGSRIAAPVSSPGRPADIWALVSGRLHVLTQVNPQVTRWHLGAVQQITWNNSKDGRTIYGVLVTPPGYRPGMPTKMVVQGHGGPEWAWWSGWLGSWHEWAQMLATHGYVVFLPNPRGSDGQGTDFARAVGDDWGGMDYQDIVDGVDMLIGQKIADPARLGIGGWSYGGFLAAWAVTHDDRFKAAVVGAGPTDLVAMARITDTPDFPLGYFGDLETHLEDYRRSSSAFLVSRVKAPVLVLHGADDTRVPPTLGLEFYRGLTMAGKTAEMVRYPKEPHWFHGAEHQLDVQSRVLAWFDKYL